MKIKTTTLSFSDYDVAEDIDAAFDNDLIDEGEYGFLRGYYF